MRQNRNNLELRKLMLEHNITQKELGERLERSQQYVSDLLRNPCLDPAKKDWIRRAILRD